MKVGIISDVHGDYATLDVTLDKLHAQHEVSHILCAGDLVGRGPQQNQVVECIREHEIITVRGNHDEWFYGISNENAAYLKSLPVDWRGELGETQVYMCHGKPGNNMWGMYRDHLSETYLNMVLRSLKVEVLVTGHTHVPLFMRVDSGVLLNPGSLYTFHSTRQTSHTYGVLNLNDLSFSLYEASSDEVLLAELEYEA